MSSPIFEVATEYIMEAIGEYSQEKLAVASKIVANYISGKENYDISAQYLAAVIGSTLPIERIRAILEICNQGQFTQALPAHEQSQSTTESGRKKARMWTPDEDIRLIAGIHKFGFKRWPDIVRFVGGGRTRPQCSQRWFRGISPKVSKNRWTEEEDEKLLLMVRKYGTNAWAKVSSEMGARCDVQCRYHYFHIAKGCKQTAKDAVKKAKAKPDSKTKQLCDIFETALVESSAETSLFPIGSIFRMGDGFFGGDSLQSLFDIK